MKGIVKMDNKDKITSDDRKKLIVRIGAVVLASAMIIPMAVSCMNTGLPKKAPDTAILQYGEFEIPTGVFVLQMMDAFAEAMPLVEDPAAPMLTQEIDGVATHQWIEDKTRGYMMENLGILIEMENRGLSLTDEDNKVIRDATEQQWKQYGQQYDSTGISVNAVETMNVINMQATVLFKDMYKDHPEQEIKDFFTENYTSTTYMPFFKNSKEDGSPLEGEELEKVKAEAQGYMDRLEKGENIEDLVIEQEKTLGEELAHEHVEGKNHSALIDNDYTNLDPEFVKQISEKAIDEPLMFENDDYIIVAVRHDALADIEVFNQLRERLLIEMKGDEFTEKLAEIANGVEAVFDEKLIAEYGVTYVSEMVGVK